MMFLGNPVSSYSMTNDTTTYGVPQAGTPYASWDAPNVAPLT